MRRGWVLAAALCCVSCAAQTPGSRWYETAPARPRQADLEWQWSVDRPGTHLDADVFVLDGFTTDEATVTDLHRADRRAVCYLEMGEVRPDRPDAARFPAELTGAAEPGSPGRRGITWSAPERITPILADRLRLCRDKNFDGVALDRLSSAPASVVDVLIDRAHGWGLPVGLVDRTSPLADFTVPREPDVDAVGSGGTNTRNGS